MFQLNMMIAARSSRLAWFMAFLLCSSACLADGSKGEGHLRLSLLSFNAWGLGANNGRPLEESLAVLRTAEADIIGLQETRAWPEDCTVDNCAMLSEGRLRALADSLGYHYQENVKEGPALSAPGAILSRFPIIENLGDGLGVAIHVAGRRIHAWNVHPTDFPYQPYQLARIEYGSQPFLHTAEEAIEAAMEARGEAVRRLLSLMASYPQPDMDIVFGDFNEPSHQDWSDRAAAAGTHPLAVEFPQSQEMETAGFVDTYRAFFPDELSFPGFTWTPMTEPGDPTDHHDRIDFIFVRGEGIGISDAAILGEASPPADIVVSPWPSDHRGVRVTIDVN